MIIGVECIKSIDDGNNKIMELVKEEDRVNKVIDNIINNDCMIKVMNKYYYRYEIEEREKGDIEEIINLQGRDVLIKIISIELTKCLFENNKRVRLSEVCYENTGWEVNRIEKCIEDISLNNNMWTTFNGYLVNIDNLMNNRINKIENLQIIEEYKNMIQYMNKYLQDMIRMDSDREGREEEMINEVREVKEVLDEMNNRIKEVNENNMRLRNEIVLRNNNYGLRKCAVIIFLVVSGLISLQCGNLILINFLSILCGFLLCGYIIKQFSQ